MAIVFRFIVSPNNRGDGYWKLNTAVLKERNYCEIINSLLLNLPKHVDIIEDPKIKWDLIKSEVKHLTISYCKNRSRNFKQKITDIEKEIEEIENKEHWEINMLRKTELETQLDELYKNMTKGAQIRSKAKWINEGEKNTSYFLRLENKHQAHNVINKVKNGSETYYKTDDILNQICSYYEDPYAYKKI